MTERARGFRRPHAIESPAFPDRGRENGVDLLADLRPFWRAVYGEAHGLLGLFSGRRAGARLGATREIYFLWPDGAHHAAAWLADEVSASRDVYQCAHLLTRPRRRKVYAAPLHSLYVDLDRAELPAGTPPPSLIVESSPDRWQCYWRLRAPVDPLLGEDLNRRLAYALGADRSGWDLTQLLRLPGTPNRKYADAPVVRIIERSDLAYDPPALDERLPLVPTAASARATDPSARDGTATTVDLKGRLSGAARRVMTGESVKRTAEGRLDRSASLLWMARVLHGAGVNRPAVVATLAERDAALGWRKYSDRLDAEEQYHRIVDLIERSAQPQRR